MGAGKARAVRTAMWPTQLRKGLRFLKNLVSKLNRTKFAIIFNIICVLYILRYIRVSLTLKILVTTAGCSQIDIFVLSFIYGCIRL